MLLEKEGLDVRLDWSLLPEATTYDVVRGELGLLQASAGDFAVATLECIASDEPSNSIVYDGDPPSTDAFWFLVRAADCGGGPFESLAASQVGLRDPEIEASAGVCLPFAI